jgi:hypothetical protein
MLVPEFSGEAGQERLLGRTLKVKYEVIEALGPRRAARTARGCAGRPRREALRGRGGRRRRGGGQTSYFLYGAPKTMITMGSPDFVWINANEIISSWYSLGAVCVAPPGAGRGRHRRPRAYHRLLRGRGPGLPWAPGRARQRRGLGAPLYIFEHLCWREHS